jgi:hypothetical protein
MLDFFFRFGLVGRNSEGFWMWGDWVGFLESNIKIDMFIS